MGRQHRLRVGNEWYRVDLLFFHRRLRCLVIIDLKLGKLSQADAGQMHLYLNYARDHWVLPGENPHGQHSDQEKRGHRSVIRRRIRGRSEAHITDGVKRWASQALFKSKRRSASVPKPRPNSTHCNRFVPSNLAKSRSKVPSGMCPALRAISRTRQSEKPNAGRFLKCPSAVVTTSAS